MYKSQTAEVLAYLEKHYTISSFECYMKLQIVDLQHAIYILRKQGYKIKDEWIHKVNRYGRRIKYKQYRLEKENGI